MKTGAALLFIIVSVLAAGLRLNAAPSTEALQEDFRQPPDTTKPWCYWYWISDHISREGITRDLEAMARAGIGEALIGNIFLEDIPAGKIKVLSEEWWSLVEHAIREGGRTGVNIGMFNSPGWSQSGGPWVKPEQAMRYLVSSELRVHGPVPFAQKLPTPATPFQDVAVLAFPAPLGDTDSLTARAPKLNSTPTATGLEQLVDGKLDTIFTFPPGGRQGNKAFALDIMLAEPLTARSVSLIPGKDAWAAQCELQAKGADGEFRPVKSFKFDRSNMEIGVGPMPRGPVTASFNSVTSAHYRLVFTSTSGKASLAELNLSTAARVESFVEKQLGKMHPTPLPMWDTYLWPAQPEPESPALAVPPGQVQDLTAKVEADGTLKWNVPDGDWVILRTGMTPTGTRNAPASPEGRGWEIDKMNRAAAKAHFDAFIGQVLQRMPAAERKAFKRVVADSYEMGSQNWTDGFARTFQKRYGYDPKPWLPALTGRVVGSADQSDRFLWDLRRLVADHVAQDYVGGLRDLCRPHGLQLWLENYGHWGFPAEFLQYGGQSDRIGGEFWVTGDLGSIELRAASSCANTYGKPIVSAEAFTGGPAFQTAPWGMKARGDWAFCEGINHFVLHVYIQQPWEDKVPGMNAWFGTEFNRHNTWFEPGKAWVDYLRRCCLVLQQGWRAADVAYFIGEDAPKMTGIRKPELPTGYDFDYINAEVILEKLSVKNGYLTLPHGTRYRLLVLPELPTMRPELLRKIRSLVKAGAIILGPPPSRSPSLENYPNCDTQVQELAAEIWGQSSNTASTGDRRLGKGRVIWGKELNEVLGGMGAGPDFQSGTRLRHTHRIAGDDHFYFVANPLAQDVATTATFRVNGLQPELWWPETGRIERAAVYEQTKDTTRLPLVLGPHGSVFVVFRQPAKADTTIVSVKRDGETILSTQRPATPPSTPAGDAGGPANNFTLAVWVKPAADTTILREAKKGVSGMSEPRNDVIFPPHGSSFGSGNHAGSGLAIGRNGVVVFEHGANYFAPVLVHATPLMDWTHLAIVYRDSQPSLYVNGELAHTGLRSDFIVHPGTADTPYRGEHGPIEHFSRPLDAREVAQLMKTMLRPGGRIPASALELTRNARATVNVTAWAPGSYELTLANGQSRLLNITAVPEPIHLDGAWDVRFTPEWGAPEKVTFPTLVDWAERPEPGIRHYSGKAVYQKKFNLPPSAFRGPPAPMFLELGKVRDLATVRLNGRDLGTLWLAPWRVDITGAARSGENVLEIEVVNTWNNRLIGDASLPAEQRRTFLAAPTVHKNGPLFPAGLLGPVTIRTGVPNQIKTTGQP